MIVLLRKEHMLHSFICNVSAELFTSQNVEKNNVRVRRIQCEIRLKDDEYNTHWWKKNGATFLFFAWSCYNLILLYGTANPSVLIGSFLVGILPYRPFPRKRSYAAYFLFSKAGKFKPNMARVPYNKLPPNLASLSHTGEYWPSVVFVWTLLRSVRTATTSSQYSPVRPSRSVSKRLVLIFINRKTLEWSGNRTVLWLLKRGGATTHDFLGAQPKI